MTGVPGAIPEVVKPMREAFENFLNGLPVRNPSKLLIIQVPQVPADVFDPDVAEIRGYQNYPPIGFLYLAAAARATRPDIEIKILDLNCEMLRLSRQNMMDDISVFWHDLIRDEIEKSSELHVCVGNNWAVVTPMFLKVTRFIRENFPSVTLVSGGVETTQNYAKLVKEDYCHIAFRYEGEAPFTAFLESCGKDKPEKVPPGVAFLSDGEYWETPPMPHPPTDFLDIRPYYDLIDVSNYHEYGGMNPFSRYIGKEQIYSAVLSNRGCRSSCSFCGVLAFYPHKVRTRTVRSVVDEIKFLVEEKGVRLVDFLDDDLVYGEDRSIELFKLMAEELPSDFGWIANNGITGCSITEEIMYWMNQSGCKGMKIGVETGNEELLKEIRKPATKDGLRKAGQVIKKYPEVHVSGNYMLGFPEENFGQLMDTFEFANELAWDWANYYLCQPAGGTPIWDAFHALGDPRCQDDGTEVNPSAIGLIPARFAPQKADFGYHKGYHSDTNPGFESDVKSGRRIFDLPKAYIPDSEQLKEIWFTFNLVTNFINNRNFLPGGNVSKLTRWFEAIHESYPKDASMCSMLVRCYRLLKDNERANFYRGRFNYLVSEFDYWKRRTEEFPELVEYAS